jgi:hypothetical protein
MLTAMSRLPIDAHEMTHIATVARQANIAYR